MEMTDQHIIVGITGGIAAYKSAELVRGLREIGADVRVVMTEAAQAFITPLTLQALSGNPVSTELFDPAAEAAMGHIELARWADLILVAPATADFIARLTHGRADDLLTCLCLASRAPIAIAPAMNRNMWEATVTQQNVNQIMQRGITVLGPAHGIQACGDIGPGRMLEPESIIENLQGMQLLNQPKSDTFDNHNYFNSYSRTPAKNYSTKTDSMEHAELENLLDADDQTETSAQTQTNTQTETSTQTSIQTPATTLPHSDHLKDISVLVTAGPTQEGIDPVRFISNHSSGKMGYAIAEAARNAGANVILITGPVHLQKPTGMQVIKITSAKEMYAAVHDVISQIDIFISVAAIGDYCVAHYATEKIKKTDDEMHLVLQRNPDILSSVAKLTKRPFCVGFAAETSDVLEYAQEKLYRKNVDMIIANQVGDDSGFHSDENQVTVLTKDHIVDLPMGPKTQIGEELIQLIAQDFQERIEYDERTTTSETYSRGSETNEDSDTDADEDSYATSYDTSEMLE